MTETQTIDSAVLDVIADPHVLKCLAQIVSAERAITKLFANAITLGDITTQTFATMQDASAAISAPQSTTDYNNAQTARRSAVTQLRARQDDAFEGLRTRITLVASNLTRAEVAE